MNTFHVVIHILKTAVVFSLNLTAEGADGCCCFLPKPHQFPSAQPLVITTCLVILAFMAITCFQRPVTYLGLLSCSLATLKFLPPPPSVKDYKGPFLPGWQGGWLWHIDWSVSLPLEGPFSFFFFFWRVGVSFYQKASSLQVRAEWDIPKSRDPWPPWRGADSQDEWISSPPTVASPIYC